MRGIIRPAYRINYRIRRTMSLDKNPETWIALWEGLSEPFKAAAFSLGLGALMAARSQERGVVKRVLECFTASFTAFGIGYICHLAGLPSWVIWAANGAVVYLGVDKVRAIVDFGVDKYIYKKDVKPDGQA